MNWQQIFYSLYVGNKKRQRRLIALMKRRFDCEIWVTREKQLIPMIFMEEDHLFASFVIMKRGCIRAGMEDDWSKFEWAWDK